MTKPVVSVRISADGKTKKVEAQNFEGPGCAAAIGPFLRGCTVLSREEKPEMMTQTTEQTETVVQ